VHLAPAVLRCRRVLPGDVQTLLRSQNSVFSPFSRTFLRSIEGGLRGCKRRRTSHRPSFAHLRRGSARPRTSRRRCSPKRAVRACRNPEGPYETTCCCWAAGSRWCEPRHTCCKPSSLPVRARKETERIEGASWKHVERPSPPCAASLDS